MSTETDKTVDLDIDYDAEVPCMVPECHGAAIWALYKPCTHTILACTPHRAEQDEWFAERPWYHAVCLTCSDPLPMPLDWRPV